MPIRRSCDDLTRASSGTPYSGSQTMQLIGINILGFMRWPYQA